MSKYGVPFTSLGLSQEEKINMPETIHCSICGKPIKVKDFTDQMDKIRHHRKLHHSKVFKTSIKKGINTRKRNK